MMIERDTAGFVQRLNGLDFGPVAYKLMYPEQGSGLNLEEATDAITKYKGFLFLCRRNAEKPVSPSLYVDYVWHTHIMDSELYTVHCGSLFGHYLHHNPFFGKRDDDADLEAASADARKQARELFGWDDDEWCGTGSRQMVSFLQNYLGKAYIDKTVLIRWKVVTCKPQSIQIFNDLVRFVDVGRLSGLENELVSARLTPNGFENASTKVTPAV